MNIDGVSLCVVGQRRERTDSVAQLCLEVKLQILVGVELEAGLVGRRLNCVVVGNVIAKNTKSIEVRSSINDFSEAHLKYCSMMS